LTPRDAIAHLTFPHDYYDASAELEDACRRRRVLARAGGGAGGAGARGLPAPEPAPRRHIALELDDSSSDEEGGRQDDLSQF
jgi:hypothetical protein